MLVHLVYCKTVVTQFDTTAALRQDLSRHTQSSDLHPSSRSQKTEEMLKIYHVDIFLLFKYVYQQKVVCDTV